VSARQQYNAFRLHMEAVAARRIRAQELLDSMHHVSRETLNRPMRAIELADGTVLRGKGDADARRARRERRRARMRLRKRRGWR
jgi:hypothetical protein